VGPRAAVPHTAAASCPAPPAQLAPLRSCRPLAPRRAGRSTRIVRTAAPLRLAAPRPAPASAALRVLRAGRRQLMLQPRHAALAAPLCCCAGGQGRGEVVAARRREGGRPGSGGRASQGLGDGGAAALGHIDPWRQPDRVDLAQRCRSTRPRQRPARSAPVMSTRGGGGACTPGRRLSCSCTPGRRPPSACASIEPEWAATTCVRSIS